MFGDMVTPVTGMLLKQEKNQLLPLFSSTCRLRLFVSASLRLRAALRRSRSPMAVARQTVAAKTKTVRVGKARQLGGDRTLLTSGSATAAERVVVGLEDMDDVIVHSGQALSKVSVSKKSRASAAICQRDAKAV